MLVLDVYLIQMPISIKLTIFMLKQNFKNVLTALKLVTKLLSF